MTSQLSFIKFWEIMKIWLAS